MIAATADGAAHMLKPKLDEKNLRRLIERADGEVIDTDELRVKFPPNKEEMQAALGFSRTTKNCSWKSPRSCASSRSYWPNSPSERSGRADQRDQPRSTRSHERGAQ